jgi:prepilin-type N-terminal cleavage/methylation domain-containing protein
VFENLHRIQRNRELNGERGFTLIELLIVIVVLGILAAIVVFALGGVTSSSAVSACNSDAKTVSVAVSAYNAQNPSGTASQANLVPTYLKSWPNNTSYYSIGLAGAGAGVYVTVTPASGTPGAPAGAQAFESGYTTPSTTVPLYTYTTGSPTGIPASLNGLPICAGV